MPNYLKLHMPQDSAMVFIDHQPQMLFGVGSIDRSQSHKTHAVPRTKKGCIAATL